MTFSRSLMISCAIISREETVRDNGRPLAACQCQLKIAQAAIELLPMGLVGK